MTDPQPLADILAGPMSRVDGCARCVNSEPARACIPIEGGWRISFVCSDCGHAWVLDWAESPVLKGVSDPAHETMEVRQMGRTPECANTQTGPWPELVRSSG